MASALDSLRAVVTTLWARPGPKPTDLIFLGATADPVLLTDPVDAADLHWALTPQGDLSYLVCGQNTLANTLFETFFRNMAMGITLEHTPVSMSLFAHHIGQNQAGDLHA